MTLAFSPGMMEKMATPRRKKARYPEITWQYMLSLSPDETLRIPEENIQMAFVAWLRETHPNVLFCANVASNVKLGWRRAKLQKAAGNTKGWPDVFIAAARGGYYGFGLELKRYYKGSKLPSSTHLDDQFDFLLKLENAGYFTAITSGLHDAIAVTNSYLNGRPLAKLSHLHYTIG